MLPSNASVRIAIALLAGAILTFEIILRRIFSFTSWHHFAFMVFSGVVLQLFPRWCETALSRAALDQRITAIRHPPSFRSVTSEAK